MYEFHKFWSFFFFAWMYTKSRWLSLCSVLDKLQLWPYPPTLDANEYVKDQFYNQLNTTLSNVPTKVSVCFTWSFHYKNLSFKTEWIHQCFKHWHFLVYIITWPCDKKDFLNNKKQRILDRLQTSQQSTQDLHLLETINPSHLGEKSTLKLQQENVAQ